MNKLIKLAVCITVVMLSRSNISFGQFDYVPATGGNNYVRTSLSGIVSSVGIGNFTNTSLPLSALHVNTNITFPTTIFKSGEVFRTDCPVDTPTFWRLYRGGTQFGRLFTDELNSKGKLDSNFQIEASIHDMIFNAGGANERMRIVGTNSYMGATSMDYAWVRAGNVGIGTKDPLSMLHIGGDNSSGAGWRKWMRIGTFYGTNNDGYDNMYVGLRMLGIKKNPDSTNIDSTYAVINWGDNPDGVSGSSKNGDRLVFNFTAGYFAGVIASDSDGIETARMWSDGNQVRTRFGYDANLTTYDPKNTVHIIGSVENGDTTKPGGNSGLRFQKLIASTPTIKNPGSGVLAVNKFGDVINVPGIGAGIEGANNGTSISWQNKVVLGNDVGQTYAKLDTNREIPMNNWDITFTDPIDTTFVSTKNRIGIGMTESSLIIL